MSYGSDPLETELRGSGPEAPAGIVRWEAPPTRGSGPYRDTALTLACRPGEWALVDEQSGDTKPNVTAWRRHLGVLLDGQAEVREVTVNGQTRVYARRKPEDTAS